MRLEEDAEGEGLEYHSSHGITQLRFPGDAFPVKNLPEIPEPRSMGLLAAVQRANIGASPIKPPRKKAAKKPPKKKAVAKKKPRRLTAIR